MEDGDVSPTELIVQLVLNPSPPLVLGVTGIDGSTLETSIITFTLAGKIDELALAVKFTVDPTVTYDINVVLEGRVCIVPFGKTKDVN
jgi:hypothetical protein